MRSRNLYKATAVHCTLPTERLIDLHRLFDLRVFGLKTLSNHCLAANHWRAGDDGRGLTGRR